MNIETGIKSVIEQKLNEGIVERLVAEQLEKGINKALEDLLGNYGAVTKIIKDKICSVMVDQLSAYDYSKYITKLDMTLTEIIKNTTFDNKKILENFRDLMEDVEFAKVVNISDIFEKYCEYVGKNVNTSDLEVNTDDSPRYNNVTAKFSVEEHERKYFTSLYKDATITFECEEDENLRLDIRLTKFDKYPWRLDIPLTTDLRSLRVLNDFQIYLIKLYQQGVSILIDISYGEEDVEVQEEPEASFS
jgi:hypothetical protein